MTQLPSKPRTMRHELFSHTDSWSHKHLLACPEKGRRRRYTYPPHHPMSCGTQARQRRCKGEHRNGCGNLDQPFPAATGETARTARRCSDLHIKRWRKVARSCQGTRAHLPAQMEGRGHEPLAAPSSPEAARSVTVAPRSGTSGSVLLGTRPDLTCTPTRPSPGFQLHISCCEEGAAPRGRTGAAVGRVGRSACTLFHSTETCPVMLKDCWGSRVASSRFERHRHSGHLWHFT